MFDLVLPTSPAGLRVEQLLPDSSTWTIVVATTTPCAICPLCQLPTLRVHSRYQRICLDLPLAAHPVRLLLHVRRFRCATAGCSRRIFTERLPGLAAPYAHRTTRLRGVLTDLGLALGGAAGARLAAHLHLPTSDDTLLRYVRAVPDPPLAAGPRVLGIDDWARRKGQRYGTILVDLETHRPVDLLPDRETATVAAWLTAHPGPEIISRDRAEAYAAAASQGAPAARQVADRFHILRNLGDALEELLVRLHQELTRAVSTLPPDSPMPPGSAVAVVPDPPAASPPPVAIPVAAAAEHPEPLPAPDTVRRQARQARYEELLRLRGLGWTQQASARHLHLSLRTVQLWLAHPCFGQRRPRQLQPRLLDAYTTYLDRRWNEGTHNARVLYQEIRNQGYRGGYGNVNAYFAGRRGAATAGATPLPKTPPLPRARALRWLLWRPVADLDDAEYITVRRVCAASQEVTVAYGLVMDFQAIVRQHQADQVGSWIALAYASGITELLSFARGVERDFAAVLAGIELPWSQGPVEGAVTRLKLLKRQHYGRAKFDLLRLRVLYAS